MSHLVTSCPAGRDCLPDESSLGSDWGKLELSTGLCSSSLNVSDISFQCSLLSPRQASLAFAVLL